MKPTKEDCATSSTPEEEAILLDQEPEPQETPEATSLPEYPEISEPTEPSEQIDAQSTESTEHTDTLTTFYPLSSTPQPGCHPSWKAKKHWREIGADLNYAGKWVSLYFQKNEQVTD